MYRICAVEQGIFSCLSGATEPICRAKCSNNGQKNNIIVGVMVCERGRGERDGRRSEGDERRAAIEASSGENRSKPATNEKDRETGPGRYKTQRIARKKGAHKRQGERAERHESGRAEG